MINLILLAIIVILSVLVIVLVAALIYAGLKLLELQAQVIATAEKSINTTVAATEVLAAVNDNVENAESFAEKVASTVRRIRS